jgi:hypothetical protein
MPGIMVHDAKGLETLVLDSMEHDKEPNAMESDTRPKVLGRNLLV